MREKIFIILGSFLLSTIVSAQNLTQQSVDKAREVIDQVIEAYGGSERLTKLNSVVVKFETSNLAVNQSRKPGPPWDENRVVGSSMIDFEKQQFTTNAKSMSERQEFSNGTIINGDKSYQVDYRANTASPIAEPNFINSAGPFIRVTPALLVKQLMQRGYTVHYLGQADVDGRAHDVLSLVMEVGPAISLYFDQKTHMLNKSERVVGTFGLIGYRFGDYKKVDGIPFNQHFKLFINEENNMKRQNIHTQINPTTTEYTQLKQNLVQVSATQPDPLRRQKVSDGVYLIGGSGTYAMFIEMDDHVIAVGGTAGITERIALLKEVVPNKPIKYGVLTHHHSDHILGGQAYAEEGAVVIAASAHEKVIRDSTENKKLKIETVNKNRTFKSGDREVRVIDIGPTEHTEHLLVVYLPEEAIIFEADHFGLRSAGNVSPASPATRAFAQSLQRNKIKVKLILSAHSAIVASGDDLQSALDKAKNMASKD
ncbi:MAG: MBL fold metallo-hydrolase [Alcanivoracaceae bacterium]|nr:MBL fold metallo-hydrolase [Alcanivoracaceae bacterium]